MTKHVINRIGCALLGLAVILGLTGTAGAAIKDNSWELGLSFPYVLFDDPAPGVSINDALGTGVRAGWNIKKGHEIEFNYYLVSTDVDIISVDVDFTTWTLGYIYNWTKNDKATPFVTAGYGSTNTDVQGFGDEDDTTTYAGGGVRWHLSDKGNFNIRFDGQLLRVDSDPDATNNWLVGVGVGWIIGGK